VVINTTPPHANKAIEEHLIDTNAGKQPSKAATDV
jgi:hypothetical protein